jgi:2-phosphosulfolactate phosphatase
MSTVPNHLSQSPHRIRLDWGRGGVHRAAERGDIVAIIDVLRFTTTVAAALSQNITIYPCEHRDRASDVARELGATVGGHGKIFSLSPLTYTNEHRGQRVVLWSPNGATCARFAGQIPHLFAGAFVNANAVSGAVAKVLNESNSNATLIACGERWPIENEDGEIRFAIEDYLGAGAILAGLDFDKSPKLRSADPHLPHISTISAISFARAAAAGN